MPSTVPKALTALFYASNNAKSYGLFSLSWGPESKGRITFENKN